MESLIDLDEQPESSDAPTMSNKGHTEQEVSLSGTLDSAGQAGGGLGAVETVGSKTVEPQMDADPFLGFETALLQPINTKPAQPDMQEEQAAQPPAQQQQGHDAARSSSSGGSAACLKAAAERAARTSDVLQQHSIEQGESNAKLR